MKKIGLYLVISWLALGVSAGQAATYTYVSLDNPKAYNGLGGGTYATGINSNGQVAGYYLDAAGNTHGFVYTAGTWTTLDNPNASDCLDSIVSTATTTTLATGINDSGQVVGNYSNCATGSHGFIYNGSTWITLDDPDGVGSTYASGINNNGQVTGYYLDAAGMHGFIYSDGNYTILDEPNTPLSSFGGTAATGINDSGQVAGYFGSADTATWHGFIYNNGSYIQLDNPNAAPSTNAYGINNSGQVAGTFPDVMSLNHGFVYSGGTYASLDYPNAEYGTNAYGINSSGQVTGHFTDYNGIHGFVATPVNTASLGISLNGSVLTIQLTAAGYKGQNADWWLVAYTPWGHWYSYVYPNTWADIGTDLSQVMPAYQGPLIDISSLALFDTTGISSGTYIVYFGVDTNMNGKLDYNLLYYSSFPLIKP